MTSTSKKIVIYLISIIGIILVLYLIGFIINNDIIFPTPSAILKALGNLLTRSNTYVIIGYTLLRLIITLLLSFLIGAILGILAGRFIYLRIFLRPWITILRSLPLAAIIVIIMILLGFTRSPYVIAMLMLVPIVYEAFLNGILNLDKELMSVWRLESNFNLKVLTMIIFPLSKPFIKTAYFQSVGLGIKVLIMAEFVCATPNSIGQALVTNANNLNYDVVFAWSIIAIVLVVILENILRLFKERKETISTTEQVITK